MSRIPVCVLPGLNVEQKIQLAFAQGDFDNLKGKGKPLQRLDEGRAEPNWCVWGATVSTRVGHVD
jgi:hypothetical protein